MIEVRDAIYEQFYTYEEDSWDSFRYGKFRIIYKYNHYYAFDPTGKLSVTHKDLFTLCTHFRISGRLNVKEYCNKWDEIFEEGKCFYPKKMEICLDFTG